MNRKPRPTKSAYQIEEEYKIAIEIRDRQLAETKKIIENHKN